MGFFDFLSGPDINTGVKKCMATKGAVLLDVRTQGEYSSGHIEGSINIPLQSLADVENKIPVKTTPIFTYCQSGARSSQATALLKQMGYTNVENIGGIMNYRGKRV